MFSNKSSIDVTQQILICQNPIDNRNISLNDKQHHSIDEENLMVDIISNEYQYESSSIDFNRIQSCCVISIISPYAFTIQLVRDVLSLDEFFRNMNEFYNSIDDLQIPREYIRTNLLCVTYDEQINGWNRSQIMEYDLEQDTVNVFFVDLNSWEENVSRSRLRFILTKYSSRIVSILTCRLAAIAPLNSNDQWTDVVLKTFENLLENRQCDIEFLYKRSDQMFYVNLFAHHDEVYVCVNDFLIHCQMAKPINDMTDEKQITYLLDENGQTMHAMLTFYWKAEEMNKQEENSKDIDKQSNEKIEIPWIRTFMINENQQMIFARYKNYIMIPWFVLSMILNETNEDKIVNLAQKNGFKAIIIDSQSHSLLYSQLSKLTFERTEIRLYSIDCVRKILQAFDYHQSTIIDLLDEARFAEANNDLTFWEKN